MNEITNNADELKTVSPDAGVEPTIEAARKEEEEYWKEVEEADDYKPEQTTTYYPKAYIPDNPYYSAPLYDPLITLYETSKKLGFRDYSKMALPPDAAHLLHDRAKQWLEDNDWVTEGRNYEKELEEIRNGNISGAYKIARDHDYYENGYIGREIGNYIISAGDLLGGLLLLGGWFNTDADENILSIAFLVGVITGESMLSDLGRILVYYHLPDDGLNMIRFAQKEKEYRANEALLDSLDCLFERSRNKKEKRAYTQEAMFVLSREIQEGNDTAKDLYEKWKGRQSTLDSSLKGRKGKN